MLLCLLGYAVLAGAAFLLAQFVIAPLYVFTEWVPEVVVELKSVTGRFWSLNRTNSAAVCLVSRAYCVTETGPGASALGRHRGAARRSDEWHSVLLPEGRNAEYE